MSTGMIESLSRNIKTLLNDYDYATKDVFTNYLNELSSPYLPPHAITLLAYYSQPQIQSSANHKWKHVVITMSTKKQPKLISATTAMTRVKLSSRNLQETHRFQIALEIRPCQGFTNHVFSSSTTLWQATIPEGMGSRMSRT